VKITVRVNEFKRLLEEARQAIPKKPILSVFAYVKVDVGDTGQATMTATDLGVSITQSFEVVEGDAGSFLLHAGKAQSLLKGLSGGTARLEGEDAVVIKAGAFTHRVPGCPVSEFPPCEPMPVATHTLSLKFLRQLLAYVERAAPHKEFKGVIPAVQVVGTADRLRAVATDGYRIAVADQKISGGSVFTLLIPKSVVPLIVRRAGGSVRLAESQASTFANVFLQIDGVVIQFRKVAGKFPGYQKATEVAAATTLEVKTAELKSVVQRMLAVADEKHPAMWLHFQNGALSANASSLTNGEAEEGVSVQNATGIENKVKLNPLDVREFLARAGDRTTISLVSERKIATFASGGFRYYIMPMFVQEKKPQEPKI
jgi:DNA polymerase-3 subunit beta